MTGARLYDGVLGATPPGLPHRFKQDAIRKEVIRSALRITPGQTDFGSLRCSVLPAETQDFAGFRMHVIVVSSETEIEIVAK
jgi:hypothetical protein